eukprot:GEMP01009233.1.p1 GENE.GEMP01009233.1~~GEMP01009233.1.p1  ORF type:complete len:607 (+),score=79.28 GEMP01009233.1:212-2032(+)
MTRSDEPPPSTARTTDFDDIIKHIGQFGPWQSWIVLCMSIVVIFNAAATVGSTFIGLVPKYRCRVPLCDLTDASYYLPNTTLPSYALSTTKEIETLKSGKSCEYYASLPNETTCGEYINVLNTASAASLSTRYKECEDKIFDSTIVSSSIVTQYGITCEKEFWADSIASLHKVGVLFGSFLAGYIGDTYGRMVAVSFGGVMTTICGVLTIFMPSLPTYAIFLVGAGFGSIPMFMCPFLMTLETTGPRYAVAVGILMECPWAFGSMLLGFEAYMIRDWIYLSLMLYIPVVFAIAVYWFVPESPRWLLAVGRTKQARRVIEKAARMNGTTYPSHLMTQESDDELPNTPTNTADVKNLREQQNETIEPPSSATVGLRDLFASRVMRLRTLNLFSQWLGIVMAFFGLTHSSTDLFGNKHLNFVFSCAVEFVGIALCLICIHSVGRKYLLAMSQLSAGVACILSALLGLIKDHDGTVNPVAGHTSAIFAFIGKASATCAFSIIYVYTAELYPTAMRSKAVGTCSTIGRLGAIAAYLVNLLKLLWSPAPSMVFGIFTLIAGFLAFALPETAGLPLPETLDEAKSIEARSKMTGLQRLPRSFRELVTDPNFAE